MGLFDFFSAVFNPDDHPPKTRHREPILTYALIETCIQYMIDITKVGGPVARWKMSFADRNQAYDFMLFCSDLGAVTSFGREAGQYVVQINAAHGIIWGINIVGLDLFIPLIDELLAGIRRAKNSGLREFRIATDPKLGELFPAFGFRESEIQPVHIGSLTESTFERHLQTLIRWKKRLITYDHIMDEARPDDAKKYAYDVKSKQWKPKVAEVKHERCKNLNTLCTYGPLVGSDWCDVDEKYVIGPNDNKMCYEIREILTAIEYQLGYENEYEEAEPQIPTDPHTRKPFTIPELAYFWVVAGNLDVRKTFPLFSAYVEAAVEGEVSNPGGPWTAEDQREILDILYPI